PVLRLVGLASIAASFLAASSTPLYATYQTAWGFSALTTTVVFGVYAITFLAALLTAGRLSDHERGANCQCARGACTRASSTAAAGLPPTPPGFGEFGVLESSPAWHPRP